MENKKISVYEEPKVEIALFNSSDIVTTSNPFGEDMDDDGWTSVG